MSKEDFDKVYEKPGAIWTIEEPPKELKELIDNKIIIPCKALDLGCGEGFYSIYLSKNGFDVTAVDFSRQALNYAKANADKAGVSINFKILDVLNLNQLNDLFGFILEWRLINYLKEQQLEGHFARIDRLLDSNGNYLMVFINDGSHPSIKDTLLKHFVIINECNIKIFDRDSSFDGTLFLLRKK